VRLGLGLGAVAAIVLVALLVPNPRPPNPAPPPHAPRAQLVTHSTYVSPAERRAIDATLDRFVPAALDRRSPAIAWRLAGPELKAGSSLREWRRGDSPVPYYPARGKRFHDWTTVDAGPGYVVFNLLVHPLHGARTSAWVFSGEMVKRGGRWLVNRLYTIATLEPPTKHGRREVGPADFAAGSVRSGPPPVAKAALGKTWLAAVAALVGLAVLFPVGFGLVSLLRTGRRRRRERRVADRTLPPLPRRTLGARPEGDATSGVAADRR
jgi:hypothetical protein